MKTEYSQDAIEILNNTLFQNIMNKTLFDILYFFKDQNTGIKISVSLKDINISPELTPELQDNLGRLTYFIIPLTPEIFAFTEISEKEMVLQIGLKSKNFNEEGNLYSLTIPFYAILHILTEQNDVLYNNVLFFNKDLKEKKGVEQSLNFFKSNPENNKFFQNK